MNVTSFLGLVQNAALLLAAAFIFDMAARQWRTAQTNLWQFLVGVIIGVVGIVIMLTPWTFIPGIVFDTRSVLLGISGLFFGALPTVIAMAMTVAFRLLQGGPGVWTGIAVILVSGTIGIVWRHYRRGVLAVISWREIYIFGIAIHLAMLGLMLTLPWPTSLHVLEKIALPVILIYPLGTTLLGLLMVNRLQREGVEKSLTESERKYRLLADHVNDVIFTMDMNLNYTYVSPSVRILRGYEPEDVMKQPAISALTPTSWEFAMSSFAEVLALENSGHHNPLMTKTLPLELWRKDGTTVWTEVKFSFLRNEKLEPVGILGITRDISERKSMESARVRLLNILESSLNEIYVFGSENLRFEYVNKGALRNLGYTYETMRTMTPVDLKPEFTIESFHKTIQPLLRHEQEQLIFNTIHRRADGSLYPVEVHLQLVEHEGQRLFLAVILDITESRKKEKEIEYTLERLRKAFGTTIQVMVSAVEVRDPYTAGHQLRVADLAQAIATEMDLPDDKIDGIKMAASIHDIGKLAIPAEILSKPTRLTEIEYTLIKEHSAKGYELLKDVESPWPLAQIVYQHHERINGSGYPQQLKDDKILIEARILSVADVVESMASHRPYRPALGIAAALDEIEKNSGILYDPMVAASCLRLFRERGYRFTN